ncbi:MAG: sigma-54-dependent Fis family transcriptional regulator [Deltaproteobacteria bacterium]|nr:sigma-54-dependent Fis family transcriptional regulator [Deltaproteobacteria bacterium]
MPTILIVDDEPGIVESLQKIFEREELKVLTAPRGEDAMTVLQQQPIDVVLTDLRMGRLSGLDLLRTIRAEYPETEVLLMTAYATVENAVEAMREGAYDVITKPFRKVMVTRSVRRALEKGALVAENRRLKRALDVADKDQSLLGSAPEFRRAVEIVDQVAGSGATVLLIGESGTGKELFARRVHRRSNRAQLPFVAINCAALPEALIESELFGHEKGAFTGAANARDGSFKRADKGTLFLDEIGELPLAMQAKLLRALQNGEIQPVGGVAQNVDVRLVAATHKDLEVEARAGRFREDLYYRLNVLQVRLPPLRERHEDIPILAQAFLDAALKKLGKNGLTFSPEALDALGAYPFPGNVRELENAIERAVLLARGPAIAVSDLPDAIARSTHEPPKRGSFVFPFGTPLEEMERRTIKETLERTKGDKELAAKLLGISLRTIYRKLGENEPT